MQIIINRGHIYSGDSVNGAVFHTPGFIGRKNEFVVVVVVVVVLFTFVCTVVYRSLGVHMSKVRSITLDSWEPELLKVMTELGNERVNQIFEAVVSAEYSRPVHNSLRSEISAYMLESKRSQKSFTYGSFWHTYPTVPFLSQDVNNHHHKGKGKRIPRAQVDLNSFFLENWRRPPGRPRTMWMKTTQQDLKALHLSLNKATDVAQNRPLWRMMSTFGTMHS